MKKCMPYPKSGDPGYVSNCMEYMENDDGELECDKCKKDHYFNESEMKCKMVPSAITDCIYYYMDGENIYCGRCKGGKYA